MTLEHRDNGGNNDGVNNVVAVECTWCGEPLPEQTGYASHIQSCPDVPQSDAREYGDSSASGTVGNGSSAERTADGELP